MIIKRKENQLIHGYDYEFLENDKKLEILYAGNLDLYYILRFKKEIPLNGKAARTFTITKENYDLYRLFDELYQDIIHGRIFEEETSNHNDYFYKDLVDEKKNITWISDEGPREIEDSMIISKIEEGYRLTFKRNNKNQNQLKSPYSICIRICNSGSRYNHFNIPFMRMFQKLQTIDPNIHQVDIEELIYQKKKDLK